MSLSSECYEENRVYKVWLVKEKVDSIWWIFFNDFSKIMLRRNSIYSIAKRRWLTPTDVLFFNNEERMSNKYRTVQKFLSQAGKIHVTVDASITSSLGNNNLKWIDNKLVMETMTSSLQSYLQLDQSE